MAWLAKVENSQPFLQRQREGLQPPVFAEPGLNPSMWGKTVEVHQGPDFRESPRFALYGIYHAPQAV